MKPRAFLTIELVSGVTWIVLGLLFCLGAVHYGVFDAVGPGPGLLPVMAGIILSSLGLVDLISKLRSGPERREVQEKFFPERDSFTKVFCTILSLVAYALAFEHLGFLLTNFLMSIFLMRFIEPQKWKTIWITALLTAGSFHLVFRIFLHVPFPKGILGI
jgi:putative tricarboxylic transport membrane protein